MALTIGELVGFIRFDASGADDGADDAENRMRQVGQNVGDDAERAGRVAGTNLGHGLTVGADGAIRDGEGQIVAQLHAVGDAAGDGLNDGVTDGAGDAATSVSDILGNIKGMLIGGAIGTALMEGLGQAMEQGNITSRLGVQLGATSDQAAKYGKIAGQMYAGALTEDFQGAADAIRATMSSGLLPPTATNKQIASIATNVNDLAETFELDLGQAANAAGQIMKTGLAPNAKTALDVITRGLQVMGPRADDIADTFNEYSTIFRQMGISAADATGIMAQGMKAGARDTDVVADSLKEFVLITQSGSKEADAAFKKIGLSGTEMKTAFTKGGPEAKAALDKVFDGMRQIKDPADRASLALTLFGTKSEDMQKALFAIDPSKATAALGKVDGAAKKMSDSLHSGPTHQIEVFKRTAMQSLVNVMGTYVIPALMKLPGIAKQVASAFQSMVKFIDNNKATFITIASVITTIMLPSLITMATTAATSAATTVAAWVTQAGAAIATGATYVGVNALIIAGWVRQGAAAVLAGARVVATWVLMALSSLASAAQMAAAWLIAMGPVGLIIAAVVALAALIIANWDTIKNATIAVWDWVWEKIKMVANFIWQLFLNFSVPGLIIKHWDTIKTATQAAWEWIKNAIQVVWDWIKTAVSVYFNAYMTVITTVWNTIKSVSQTVWNAIKGVVLAVWTALKTGVTNAINNIKSIITTVWNAIKSLSSTVWNGIKTVISGVLNTIKSTVSGAVNSIKGFFSSGFNAIKSTVSNALTNVVSTIKGLAGKVKSAVSGAATWLVNAGKSIITGLINGIKSMAGKVGDAVKGVLKGARDLLPFSPAKKGPFSGKGWTLYSGRAISEALARGILQRKKKIAAATKAAVIAARQAHLVMQQSTQYQTGQQSNSGLGGNESAGVQNGVGGKMLNIQNYWESESGSATKTALELEWLARARG